MTRQEILRSVRRAAFEFGFLKIIETVAWLAIGISTSVLVPKALADSFHQFAPYKWELTTILCGASILLIFAIYRRFNRFRPRFTSVSCAYSIVRNALHYEYLDDVHMRHLKTIKIKALTRGVSSYHDRYIWTGDGAIEVRCRIKGQAYMDRGKLSGYQCYAIALGRTLNKGEECEVEIEWTLTDSGHRAQPFLATTIREPTDDLVMSVKLPANPGEAICEVRTHGSVLVPTETTAIRFDRSNTAVWFKHKPKLLHHYQMRWYS
jgi:hypothetical protein